MEILYTKFDMTEEEKKQIRAILAEKSIAIREVNYGPETEEEVDAFLKKEEKEWQKTAEPKSDIEIYE